MREIFAGGGEMGARMAAYDWSRTPLGPHETWPQSLKTAVGIMLASRYAMWMAWGDELTFFYNDAYQPTLGVKAAWALGTRSDRVWAEIWSEVGPRIDIVLRTGTATWDESLQLFLERSGYAEETYHTFSYSPLRDDQSAIAGMLCVVTEETERVIGERRLGILRNLAAELSMANTERDVGAAVERSIGADGRDLPFTLTYLFEPDGMAARLVGTTGIPAGHPAAPVRIEFADGGAPWPARALREAGKTIHIDDLARLGPLPAGPWSQAPHQALLCPIGQAGQGSLGGFLVAGLNPFRPFDAAYAGFVELVSGQIAAGLDNAHAYEQERRRADALAELDRAKTTFFSNVSHEFRTPLTLILSPLEELLAGPAAGMAPAKLALVETAHRNGLRLLKLVNTLLDFARIEAGRVQATYRPVDLAAFTADIASSFRSAMEQAGLDFRVVTAPLPQPVHVDRDMWEKVVLNLLSNAFKFTFEGSITVVLEEEAGGEAVLLTVRDTGTGIPGTELPHLFERFRRVDGARGRSFEGSGIGLALVQELVKLQGGSISVASEEGRGTTFSVRIPFGTDHLPADRIFGESPEGTTVSGARAYVEEALRWLPDAGTTSGSSVIDDELGLPQAPIGTGRILLADDNADMRDYVRRLLVAQGYEVEAVGDGQAALAAARERKPDLVLSDVMMPGLDGFGLLRALRDDERLRDLPIILLSARAGEEARVEGSDAGADDYLTKPFSTRELLARIGANLAMARVRRDSLQKLRELNESLEARVAKQTQERDRIWRLSRELMLVAEFDSTALALNPAWGSTLDWSEADLLGAKVFGLVHPADVGAATQVLRQLGQGVPVVNVDLRLRHRDGSYRWTIWTAVPHEGVLYAVGRDVTDSRATEERLRQAQKMETIGQLTGGVAHDFNNLLTVIVGNLESIQHQAVGLEGDGAGPRIRRAAEYAMRGAQRAAALTQRLLAFSRRQPLEPKQVNINRLVAGMSDLIRRTLGEQVEIETVLGGGLWLTLVDPNQLENAILNLAVNARDAMPDGGRLTIETGNAHLDELYAASADGVQVGQYVLLAVSDTGSGMSPDISARAFEPFFTTKDAGHGTGLGLSQVYGFVKQSGGHVKIYSEIGHGTTVKIYLPRLMAEEEEAVSLEQVAMPAPGEHAETVLVVEDDDDVRAYSTQLVRELGYRVLEARSGPVALEALERHPVVDLLFTDVGLPGGMNGRQLAEAVARLRPGLPILFTTGYARNAIVHGGRLDPGLHLITKPFTRQGLAAKLRDVLDQALVPPRILVVEDDALVRMVAVEALAEAGFVVEEAASADEAVAVLGAMTHRFDAAILDFGLPDRRADQLAGELRALRPDLPLLIASGYDAADMRQRFGSTTSLAFVAKPYDAQALCQALAKLGVRMPRRSTT